MLNSLIWWFFFFSPGLTEYCEVTLQEVSLEFTSVCCAEHWGLSWCVTPGHLDSLNQGSLNKNNPLCAAIHHVAPVLPLPLKCTMITLSWNVYICLNWLHFYINQHSGSILKKMLVLHLGKKRKWQEGYVGWGGSHPLLCQVSRAEPLPPLDWDHPFERSPDLPVLWLKRYTKPEQQRFGNSPPVSPAAGVEPFDQWTVPVILYVVGLYQQECMVKQTGKWQLSWRRWSLKTCPKADIIPPRFHERHQECGVQIFAVEILIKVIHASVAIPSPWCSLQFSPTITHSCPHHACKCVSQYANRG